MTVRFAWVAQSVALTELSLVLWLSWLLGLWFGGGSWYLDTVLVVFLALDSVAAGLVVLQLGRVWLVFFLALGRALFDLGSRAVCPVLVACGVRVGSSSVLLGSRLGGPGLGNPGPGSLWGACPHCPRGDQARAGSQPPGSLGCLGYRDSGGWPLV